MAFPIKVCSICSEEFELKPDKPGFANRLKPHPSAPWMPSNARLKVKQTRHADKQYAISCIARIADDIPDQLSNQTPAVR
jgi:hypothetical protein